MRRHWKRFAKRASNAACDDQERTEALADVLQRDWNLEVPAGLPRRLRDVLDDRQGDLLGDSAPERLEVLRGEPGGTQRRTTRASSVLPCSFVTIRRGVPRPPGAAPSSCVFPSTTPFTGDPQSCPARCRMCCSA